MCQLEFCKHLEFRTVCKINVFNLDKIMSSALFKKSLEIVDGGLKPKRKGSNNQPPSALDLIPDNHRLLKTIKRKGHTKTKLNEISETKKLTVEDIRKQIRLQGDQTEANLNKLLKFSSFNKIEEKTIEKIVRRAQVGHYIVPEVPKPVIEESIFTEEDFANLEKELFFDD